MKTIWTFKTKNFTVRYMVDPERFDPMHMEPELVKECREKIASKEWQCFTAIIEVKHKPTGDTIGTSYLGQCIYADPKDFMDHKGMNAGGYGSYFSQMVREAVAEARGVMEGKRKSALMALEKLNKGLVVLKEAA